MTDEEMKIFEALRRAYQRQYSKKRYDKTCHKCKTELPEGATECPKCGTKKRKYAPRSTRKDGYIPRKTKDSK
jgi:rRNA maturation endonuclease Nob1